MMAQLYPEAANGAKASNRNEDGPMRGGAPAHLEPTDREVCVKYLGFNHHFTCFAAVIPLILGVMTLPRYDHCPNCGESSNALRVIFRCDAEHLFCEMCCAAQLTEVLKIRLDVCPTCGQHAYERAGWTQIDRGAKAENPRPPECQ
jgi:hypothetical protein